MQSTCLNVFVCIVGMLSGRIACTLHMLHEQDQSRRDAGVPFGQGTWASLHGTLCPRWAGAGGAPRRLRWWRLGDRSRDGPLPKQAPHTGWLAHSPLRRHPCGSRSRRLPPHQKYSSSPGMMKSGLGGGGGGRGGRGGGLSRNGGGDRGGGLYLTGGGGRGGGRKRGGTV